MLMKKKKDVLVSDLPQYIEELKYLMKKKGYSDNTITNATHVWREIMDFSSHNPAQLFNEDYRKKYFDAYSLHEASSTYHYFKSHRYVYLLVDYIKYGVIFRVYCTPNEVFNKEYIELFEGFIEEEKKRNLSESTLKIIRTRLFRFQDFLIDTGTEKFCDITQDQLNDYISSLAHFSSHYIAESLRIIKRLSDYAFINGYIEKSFSDSIPIVKICCQQKLPSTFNEDEIKKIEQAIDRSNPTGKKDYAIFLLAAKLGIRRSDIVRIKISDINWDKKELSFVQYKTGRSVYLPLPDDVGWAIIDYLKNGRPESESKYIFIAHRSPYNELSSIDSVISRLLRKAKIRYPSNKRVGFHAFRHSLATRMLDNDVPLPIISQTLGHSGVSSTDVYLRINISQLSKCGLEVNL